MVTNTSGNIVSNINPKKSITLLGRQCSDQYCYTNTQGEWAWLHDVWYMR